MPENAPRSVLIVDDNEQVRASLQKVFDKSGYRTRTAEDGREALEQARREPPDAIVADLRMPCMDGMSLLKAVKKLQPDVRVVVITGYGTIDKAVEAMKEGASDFILKPFKRATIVEAVRLALETQTLPADRLAAGHARSEEEEEIFRGIIGTSREIEETLDLVQRAAPSAATVLIEGESGTGKEIIADAIHHASPRRNRPYIKVNCAALPETLLEAELFGYERGAFTGAVSQRKGRFELADTGTFFLDEVGLLSPSTQVKLLRILQNGQFERLGGTRTLKVDVRLIAATNHDLEEALQRGEFREDLFYRLNVIRIQLAPLRQRRTDVPALVAHFIQMYADRNQKRIRGISRDAMQRLVRYPWPGNIRELENTIERAVVLTRADVVSAEDLPEKVRQGPVEADTVTIPIGTTLKDIERRVIEETLRFTGGDKTAAANLLGIASRTIYRKLTDFDKTGR